MPRRHAHHARFSRAKAGEGGRESPKGGKERNGGVIGSVFLFRQTPSEVRPSIDPIFVRKLTPAPRRAHCTLHTEEEEERGEADRGRFGDWHPSAKKVS